MVESELSVILEPRTDNVGKSKVYTKVMEPSSQADQGLRSIGTAAVYHSCITDLGLQVRTPIS